jgi:hypothetical protein
LKLARIKIKYMYKEKKCCLGMGLKAASGALFILYVDVVNVLP